jgi:hypothetical protein
MELVIVSLVAVGKVAIVATLLYGVWLLHKQRAQAMSEETRRSLLYGLILALALQAGNDWPIWLTMTHVAVVLLFAGYLMTGDKPTGRQYLYMVGMVAFYTVVDKMVLGR